MFHALFSCAVVDKRLSVHQGGQEQTNKQTHFLKVFIVIDLFKCYFCQIIMSLHHFHEPVLLLVYFSFKSLQTKQYDGSAPLHQWLSQHISNGKQFHTVPLKLLQIIFCTQLENIAANNKNRPNVPLKPFTYILPF